MTYDKKHTEDDCDKCLKRVGKKNLISVSFIYLDRNDHVHPDVICPHRGRLNDYKQYWVCKECDDGGY